MVREVCVVRGKLYLQLQEFEYHINMDINDPRVGKNINELALVLSQIKDEKLIEEFFRSLLTPAEIADIASRWALVKALQKKVPQREIARDLGISLCKITRGSRELKKENSAFARAIEISAGLQTGNTD